MMHAWGVEFQQLKYGVSFGDQTVSFHYSLYNKMHRSSCNDPLILDLFLSLWFDGRERWRKKKVGVGLMRGETNKNAKQHVAWIICWNLGVTRFVCRL